MKKFILPCMLVSIVVLAACKKDSDSSNGGGGGNKGIDGAYQFKYLRSKQDGLAEATTGEKTVTKVDYTTINNAGSLTFNNGSTQVTGLTYEIDGLVQYYVYDSGVEIDNFDLPITFSVPASNSTSSYTLIGADSIYFPGGSLTPIASGSGSIPVAANGGRYKINGNLLTLTQVYALDSSYQESGETIHLNQSAITTVVLEKQ